MLICRLSFVFVISDSDPADKYADFFFFFNCRLSFIFVISDSDPTDKSTLDFWG